MAELTMRQTVLTAILDADPTVREQVKQRLSADLMKSIPLATRFGGEIIVSLEPIKEIQIKDLCSVRFEQSVSLTPLVRCRECEDWQTSWEPYDSRGDEHFCAVAGKVTRGHFYCADGERKNGGQDGTA